MKKIIKNFFLLTTLTSASIYGINQFIQFTSTTRNLTKKHTGEFFLWKYGNIFYSKHGTGTPVLLIHDLHPASSSMEWMYFTKYLEKNHCVYTIDLLGCGKSDKPALTYTNYMYVQLICDFIKNVIGEKTDLIATGDSASFSIMSARMEPSLIEKIFLIQPSSLVRMDANPTKSKNLVKGLIELPLVGTFLYYLLHSQQKIENLFLEQYFFKHTANIVKLKDMYYESAHLKGSGGRFLTGSILANYTNINIVPALKKIEHPIYIIESRELEISSDVASSYQQFDPSIETVLIEHCRKLPQLEEPEKLSHMINIFYS